MQLGGDLEITWLMFNHCKHVLGWSTMAWQVYDPNYVRVMTIAIYDMQLEDVESQVLMWRALMKLMKANGIHMPQFRGFIIDNVQVN
jgi:hypothetical protein